jgi:hypothetical protein
VFVPNSNGTKLTVYIHVEVIKKGGRVAAQNPWWEFYVHVQLDNKQP